MHYIFYFLQLISPNSIQGIASTPPISVYERSYEEMDRNVAHQDKEATCLAKALYYEGRGESKNNMTLIGLVILNRTKNPKYPNTVCGVVKERGAFQYYPYLKHSKPKEHSRYLLAQAVARDLLSGKHNGKMSSSVLWFKQCSYRSEFFNKLQLYGKQGSHCFFEEKRV